MTAAGRGHAGAGDADGAEVTVRERPTLGVGTIVASTVFLVGGLFALAVPPAVAVSEAVGPVLRGVVGVAGVAAGAGGLVLGLRGLLRPRVLLRVEARGVTVDRYPLLPWGAIADIEVGAVSYARGRQLLLRLADGIAVPPPRRGVVAPLLHRIGAGLVWGTGRVPVRADTELPPDDVRALLLDARRQHAPG